MDIGSASIKLVELSKQAHGCRVEAYGMEPLPPNSVVDGQFSDVERIGEAIRELKRRCGCRSKQAALALSGPSALIKTFAVDATLADADVEATIEVEAERHLPGPPDEVAYDFEVQGLSPLDPKQAEVVLAACPKAQLAQGLAVLRAAHLQPIAIEIKDLAVARGLAEARVTVAGEDEGLTALFDVASGAAKLRVFERGLCIHRATETFETPLGLSDPVGDESAHSAIDAGPLARVAAQALECFAASAAPARVGAALFAGAGVGSALVDLVDERLPVRAAVANPFRNMSLAPRIDRQGLFRDAPRLLTACGLALRSGP
ncbi:MAG: pilus assembly protein PilM [Gammaproteobacteria bacterium]|nr:pilus assembly protein PilM [Gammaproteobacteria bacterium]